MSGRIAAGLKHVLGGHPEFWSVLEEDGKHRLHVHGSVGVSEEQRRTARIGLKKAGGAWSSKGIQFQLSMRPNALDADLRGSSYAGKRLQWASPSRRRCMERFGGHPDVPLFQGKALSVTRKIRIDAHTLYEQARQLVIAFRKRKNQNPRHNPADPPAAHSIRNQHADH